MNSENIERDASEQRCGANVTKVAISVTVGVSLSMVLITGFTAGGLGILTGVWLVFIGSRFQ